MHAPHGIRASGSEIWEEHEASLAFDRVAEKNPKHQGLFEKMRNELLRTGPIDRVYDVGGATGLFANYLRKNGNDTPVTIIDPGESGTTAIAAEKLIPRLEIVPQSFEVFRLKRSQQEQRISVVTSYFLHNLSPDGRDKFFLWLSFTLESDEVFILGDTIADYPVESEKRKTAECIDKCLQAVGVSHWQDDESIPQHHRQALIDHTKNDATTAPDIQEYMNLVSKYGFSMEIISQDGYLHVIIFRKLRA